MGGSSKQTRSSTQTTYMPEAQEQNFQTLMGGAQDLWRSGGPKYFQGQNYTDPTANQLQGRQMMTNFATGAGQNMVGQALAGNNFWMDPNVLSNPSRVPGYDATRQGIVTDVTRNLTENILPQTRGAAITGGGLGGSRQQMADALATGRTNTGLAQALGNLDLGIYGQNLAAHQNALNRAPAMMALGSAPGEMVQAVGGAERSDAENQLRANMERWNYDQNRFPQLLAMLQSLTGTAGQYGGTTTGKETIKGSGGSGWMQGLGGLMSLGGMLMGGMGAPAAGLSTSGGLGSTRGVF